MRVLWDTLGFLEKHARNYGDVVCLFRNRFYLVNHPDHVRRLLHNEQEIYSKNRRGPRPAKAPLTEKRPPPPPPPPREPKTRPEIGSMGRHSVALSEDETWRRRRKLVQPAFHRREFKTLAEGVTAATAAMLVRWRQTPQHGAVIEAEQEMIDLILKILVESFFGDSVAGRTDETAALINDIHEYFDSRTGISALVPESLPTPANRRLKRSFDALTDFIYEAMDERLSEGGEQRDLLGRLLLTRDRETGEGLSRKEVYDEIFMLSTLGHKTTAEALTWTLYLLSQAEDVDAQLHQELVRELGERRPTLEDLPRLPYLRQVIEESMRLYPPTWLIGRMTLEDDEIGGYRIPAGAYTVFSPYLLHRHPDFWDQPDRFNPDRFAPERSAERPRYAYVPFGGGARICMAKNFAMMEISLVLAEVVRSFRFELKSGHRVRAQPQAVLRPRRGVPLILHPRV